MGTHYRRTRKPRCVERIKSIIDRVRQRHSEDLGQQTVSYGGVEVKVSDLLARIDTLGYKSLLKLYWSLDSCENFIDIHKGKLIHDVIFEAGKQGLTPEDVLILAGQQYPSENIFRAGGIDLEFKKKCLDNEMFSAWHFLDDLYRYQLEAFYLEFIQPRSKLG
jgi:hypothetical protein